MIKMVPRMPKCCSTLQKKCAIVCKRDVLQINIELQILQMLGLDTPKPCVYLYFSMVTMLLSENL
jgi:hypothetical protein